MSDTKAVLTPEYEDFCLTQFDKDAYDFARTSYELGDGNHGSFNDLPRSDRHHHWDWAKEMLRIDK
jgi:hypothetical protein